MEAIHSLQAEGKLPEDFAVPCQIVTVEHAPEMIAEKKRCGWPCTRLASLRHSLP
jgi:hypothetical protein